MKSLVCVMVLLGCVCAWGQQAAAPAASGGLDQLSWMKGDWAGKQDFNTNGGDAMVGDATDKIDTGIAGKYLCEMLSTTLPGRKPTDTRHFISWDAKAGQYTAWWFNDTSTHPMELTGSLSANKLVLFSNPAAPGPVLRATYDGTQDGKLTFLLEMKMGDAWSRLFLTTYEKK